MLRFLEKNPIVSLSILLSFMLLIHLDIPNVTIMEARNFITAREMVQDNNWLLTTMNGEPRYQKPPLPTWLSATSGLIFGMNSLYALRLPAALMVLFLAIFCYLFSKIFKLSNRHALNNALIAGTSFYIIAIINEAPWDIFTHGFMLASIYFLVKTLTQQKKVWQNTLLASVFFGLSFLSKGPISFYALFLPFLLSYFFVFKPKNLKAKIIPGLGFLLIGFLIGGWWFAYVRYADPKTFLEITTKETGNWSSYNVRPFYYYWSFFTQSGLWTIPALISLFYPYISKKTAYKKAYKFTFWWTIISVLLLSIIPEKKSRYLMPVLIPLALNTGFYIEYLIHSFRNFTSKGEKFPVYFNFGLFALIGIASPIGFYFLIKSNFEEYLVYYILASISLLVVAILIVKNLRSKNFQNVFLATVLFMVFTLGFGLPLSKNLQDKTAFQSIFTSKESKIPVYAIGEAAPEFIWKYNGKIKNIYKNKQISFPKNKRFGVLVYNRDTKEFKKMFAEKYQIQFSNTFNLNVGRKKRERLVRDYYIVLKK